MFPSYIDNLLGNGFLVTFLGFFLTVYRISVSVSKRFESLIRNFLLEGGGSHLVKWELATKLVELRGFGRGSMRLCNEALLANCLWRFFIESDTLRYRVVDMALTLLSGPRVESPKALTKIFGKFPLLASFLFSVCPGGSGLFPSRQ